MAASAISGFAFESVREGSDAQPEKKPPKKSADADGSATTAGGRTSSCAVSEEGSGQCLLCEEPKKHGSFCGGHKKGYETVYRSATTPAAKEKPSADASWEHELEAWVGSDYWFFLKIFGDASQRKKMRFADPTKAHQILIDFVLNNPDGKEKRKAAGSP